MNLDGTTIRRIAAGVLLLVAGTAGHGHAENPAGAGGPTEPTVPAASPLEELVLKASHLPVT
jgi:hypothetical protein